MSSTRPGGSSANLGIGEWLQQSFKLSRALGTQNVVVLHRLSDLHAAGAGGSRELRLAEGLLADAETKVSTRSHPTSFRRHGSCSG